MIFAGFPCDGPQASLADPRPRLVPHSSMRSRSTSSASPTPPPRAAFSSSTPRPSSSPSALIGSSPAKNCAPPTSQACSSLFPMARPRPTIARAPENHNRRNARARRRFLWGATTVLIKATALARASAAKVTLYQLAGSAPVLLVLALLAASPSPHPTEAAWLALLYQTVGVAFLSYLAWFALIARFPRSRSSPAHSSHSAIAGPCRQADFPLLRRLDRPRHRGDLDREPQGMITNPSRRSGRMLPWKCPKVGVKKPSPPPTCHSWE